MKKKFLELSMKSVKKGNPDFDQDKLDEIEYGLEAIYLTLSKMIIIFGVAMVLGIVKEVILVLLFYNIIRTTAFGLHATKSIYCLITSLVFFIGGAIICKSIFIPYYLKIIISLLLLICIFKYAPADTHKRPLINEKKRKRFKIISIISSVIYVILVIILKDNVITNYIIIGMSEAVIMIHPIVYKIFKLPYNNYKNYNNSVVNV